VIAGLCLAAPTQEQGGGRNPCACHFSFKLVLFMSSWFFLSGGLTVFNKWVFVDTGGNFPYVSILSWFHMASATVLTRALRYFRPDFFPAVEAKSHETRNIMKLVLPVAILQSFVLVLGNSAYLYLSVSYIQMIKAAMPAMVFIISCLMRIESFSVKETIFLLLIGAGVGGCSHGEALFSWTGFGFQMASFCLEACRLILLKTMLSSGTVAPLDPLSGLYFLAPLNALCLTLPMALEARHVGFEQILDLRFVFVSNCLTAFALNIAGVCFMSMASAVQFAVVGLLKDFTLIVGSTFVFGNMLTREELLGTIVVTGAAVAFQRYQQDKTSRKMELASRSEDVPSKTSHT
jgi:hypothetical protein